ncbi:MAG: glycosyltransferase family 39 protein, partial [Chloroflexota bacterium]|nr:glycosyltransferase family 39 protein [Chloroflexota bacterium]
MTPEEEIARLKAENLALREQLAEAQEQLARAGDTSPDGGSLQARSPAAEPTNSHLAGNPTTEPGTSTGLLNGVPVRRAGWDQGNGRGAGEVSPNEHVPAVTESAEPGATNGQATPAQAGPYVGDGAVGPWVPVADAQAAPSDVAPHGDTKGAHGDAQEKEEPSRSRAVEFGVLAFLVGAAGEALLFQEPMRGIGAVVQVGAVVLAILAWGGMRERPILSPRPAGLERLITWRAGLAFRLAGIAGALGLWAASMLAYLARPDEIFGLQGWLWLAAILLFVVSCLRWRSRSKSDADTQEEVGQPWTRNETLILAGIVALSFFMRVPWLRELPWDIKEDVFLNWRETWAFTDYPPKISLFTTTYIGLGQPSLWFAVPALSMKVFGTGLVGMRMPVAIFGSLLVLPVYGIARLSWGKTAAGVAAFAVAVSASMIHWS